MPPGEFRLERVVVETDRYRVEGDVRCPKRLTVAEYLTTSTVPNSSSLLS